MCGLSKNTLCFVMGLAIGIMVGYQKEAEIEEISRNTKRAKRNMMRKMYDIKDHFDM